MAAMAIVAALIYRLETGIGQKITVSVHDAVSKNTETDLPDWVYLRDTHYRRTCRHSLPRDTLPALSLTKDGRWLLPYKTYLPGIVDGWAGSIDLLSSYGLADDDLRDEKYLDGRNRTPAIGLKLAAQVDRLIGSMQYDRDLWRQAQARGLAWAPIRKPEENLDEDHWARRETFVEVDHPEEGRRYPYVGAKWYAPEVPWRAGPRAPRLGEHNARFLPDRDGAQGSGGPASSHPGGTRTAEPRAKSPLGKPFALDGVRVVDLTWLLASAGAGRYLAALGADVIKVEHSSRWDAIRFGPPRVALDGRAERDRAVAPIPNSQDSSPNRSGFFMEINAGKRAISLNLKHERGRELLWELIRISDIVIEGFSPGTMERMGFGYEALKAANPSVIYVQQSGTGQIGTYGSTRSFGPTAQALAGLSEMSGLPEPYAPAGIGYSYLDWFGAYNMANAILAALYRKKATGRGCYIDSSQVEAGTFLTGTAVLDHAVNGRTWQRYGNRSPYKPAAPHGIYRCAGVDRWIALACFTDHHWSAAMKVLGGDSLLDDPRFVDLDSRLAHQDELDTAISTLIEPWDEYELMDLLQGVGVPAGVCQNAEDRCERDPQLRETGWLRELEQTEIGWWPVKEMPARFSETPAYIGGAVDRHGPSYGEDNDDVFGSILGLSAGEIAALREEGVI
jgi:crotonobetainyl-CoA:carnitine CoA-transferase CaiB-like acyl-CoA transferase